MSSPASSSKESRRRRLTFPTAKSFCFMLGKNRSYSRTWIISNLRKHWCIAKMTMIFPMGNWDMFLTKCGYNCICPFFIPTISFLCLNFIYQIWFYPKHIHPVPAFLSQWCALCLYCIHVIPEIYPFFFYITSNLYPNNTPIPHWDLVTRVLTNEVTQSRIEFVWDL